MKNILLYLISILTLMGSVSAGTVTLTGGCTNQNISGNTISFNLLNSGNDTAFNLILNATIPHARTTQSVYPLNILGPGANATFEINISNVSERGTSAVQFTLAYQQGTSVFTAVFPCLAPIKNSTVSHLYVSLNKTSVQSGVVSVRVNLFNAGTDTESANVSLMLPPTFSYKSSPVVHVTLAPYKTDNVTFSLGIPGGSPASYSAAAVASYSKDNLSYTSLVKFVIDTSASSSGSIFSSLILYAALAVAVVVIVLILLSLRRKRAAKSS